MELEDQITEMVAAGVLLLVGAVILSNLAVIGGGGPATTDASLLGGEVPGGIIELNDVEESLGTEYSFDGSGGLNGDMPDPPDDGVEFCTFVAVDGATGTNQTVANANGELVLQYHGNRTDAKWVGYRYDESSTASADVAVPAPNPGTQTHVCAREQGDTLTLNASGNESSATVGSDAVTVFDSDAPALTGDLEETRLYPETLKASQRSQLRTEPTAPVSGARPIARVMYDRRGSIGSSVSSADIRFAGTTASVSGAVLDGGFAGRTVGVGDVQINEDRNKLTATEGGPLDGAPVAFIDYESGGFGYQTIQLIESAFQFAPVLLIVGISLYILIEVRSIRD